MNTIKVTKLTTNGNVRSGSKKKNEDYKSLKSSISSIGVQIPITVVKEGGAYVILDGHQRYFIAKELKINELPFFEVSGDVNSTVHQLTANMYSVPMTPLEAAEAIGVVIKNNPNITYKQIAGMFGKGVEWVSMAVRYNNLIPKLRQNKYSEDHEALIDIARYSQASQQIAYESTSPEDGQPLWRLSRIYRALDSRRSFSDITKVIDKKTFRNREKEAGIAYEKPKELFSDLIEADYNDEPEFLTNVFFSETEVGKLLPNDLLIVNEISGWSNNSFSIRMDQWNKLQSFYKTVKTCTGDIFKDIRITAWNGDVFYPAFNYKADVKNVTETDEVDIDKYKSIRKKFARAIAPVIIGYIDVNLDKRHITLADYESLEDRKPAYTNLLWLLKSVGTRLDFHSGKITGMSSIELLEDRIHHWIDFNMKTRSFEQIKNLLSMNHLNSMKVIIAEEYNSHLEFRRTYLNAFTLKKLKTISSYTDENKMVINKNTNKKDLVGLLVSELLKPPFLQEAIKELPYDDWGNYFPEDK